MAEHQDQRRSEHCDGVLDRAERARVHRVAGDAHDEQLAQSAAEQVLGRRARIRAANDHGNGPCPLASSATRAGPPVGTQAPPLTNAALPSLSRASAWSAVKSVLAALAGLAINPTGSVAQPQAREWNKARRESWFDIEASGSSG
jgi:hypothetical protein